MDYGKVSIIGAGTAGLIAAKRLGSYGIDTTVYDQKAVLGYPVRASGILSVTGLSTLGIDYSACITNTLYGANLHAGGRVMRIITKKPVAHILDRMKLNERCMDEALASGARVITKRRVLPSEFDSMAGRGVLVGADGAVSSVAKHFSLGEMKSIALTYKADFNVEAPESGMVDLFFDRMAYRGLFAWLAPNSRNDLEVGVGIDSRYGNAKRAFEHFMKNQHVREIVGGRRPMAEGASIIPMTMRRRIASDEKGVVLVGDAAGQVKATTGGGIIFGGNGAIMAADTISKCMDGKARLSDYETDFRKRYELDLKLHSMTNRLYSAVGPRATGAAIGVLNAIGMDRFLSTYGDMDRPSLILKRFFLRGLA